MSEQQKFQRQKVPTKSCKKTFFAPITTGVNNGVFSFIFVFCPTFLLRCLLSPLSRVQRSLSLVNNDADVCVDVFLAVCSRDCRFQMSQSSVRNNPSSCWTFTENRTHVKTFDQSVRRFRGFQRPHRADRSGPVKCFTNATGVGSLVKETPSLLFPPYASQINP